MEEKNMEELTPVGRDGVELPQDPRDEQKQKELEKEQAKKRNAAAMEERARLFRMLGGAYLLYLAYQLGKSALAETGWTSVKIAGIAAGVFFVIAGIWLLVVNGKAFLPGPGKPNDSEEKDAEDDEGEAQ